MMRTEIVIHTPLTGRVSFRCKLQKIPKCEEDLLTPIKPRGRAGFQVQYLQGKFPFVFHLGCLTLLCELASFSGSIL